MGATLSRQGDGREDRTEGNSGREVTPGLSGVTACRTLGPSTRRTDTDVSNARPSVAAITPNPEKALP